MYGSSYYAVVVFYLLHCHLTKEMFKLENERRNVWKQNMNTQDRPISLSQVEALLPSRLSNRSHVSGSLSFIRCPALSRSHVPFIPLRVNAFMSEGYLEKTNKQPTIKLIF